MIFVNPSFCCASLIVLFELTVAQSVFETATRCVLRRNVVKNDSENIVLNVKRIVCGTKDEGLVKRLRMVVVRLQKQNKFKLDRFLRKSFFHFNNALRFN